MKLNFGKRLVLFLHWLLSLVVCILLIGLLVWPELVQGLANQLNGLVGAGVMEIAGIAAAVLYVLLSVLSVAFILRGDKAKKRSDRGFVTVDSSEAGRTRIAIGAVEQMIRQAVRVVDGIADMKTSIVNGEDSISINTSVAIVNGAHVPTVTMNIQRAVRSYIELNCGIAVREVSVSVHTLAGEDDGKGGRRKGIPAAPSVPQVQSPVAEPVKPAEEAPAQEAEISLQEENTAAETQPETGAEESEAIE